MAPARALLSAASPVRDSAKIHGRFRDAGLAAARLHARGRRRAAAGCQRGSLHAMISRREFLGVAAVAVNAPLKPRAPFVENGARALQDGARGFSRAIIEADGYAVDADGRRLPQLGLDRRWDGALCRSTLTNRGAGAVGIKEVVLIDCPIDLPAETK